MKVKSIANIAKLRRKTVKYRRHQLLIEKLIAMKASSRPFEQPRAMTWRYMTLKYYFVQLNSLIHKRDH